MPLESFLASLNERSKAKKLFIRNINFYVELLKSLEKDIFMPKSQFAINFDGEQSTRWESEDGEWIKLSIMTAKFFIIMEY